MLKRLELEQGRFGTGDFGGVRIRAPGGPFVRAGAEGSAIAAAIRRAGRTVDANDREDVAGGRSRNVFAFVASIRR